MQKTLKKIWPVAASLVVFTSLCFADTDDVRARNLESRMEASGNRTAASEKQIAASENRLTALEQQLGANGEVTPSGRAQVNSGANLFITADALYWDAHEGGLPLFIENNGQGFSSNLNNADAKGLHWKWNWGFRLGLGYNTPHDGWDLVLTWTRIDGRAHEREEVGNNDALWGTFTQPGAFVINPVTLVPITLGDGLFTKSHTRWKLQLNQIDLDIGREFFVSKCLTLRPYFGLRTDWIHQKLNIHYNRFRGSSGQSYEVELYNHFWGLGVAAGLDTQWSLGKGWSIYGNAAFAILYGFHKLDREDELSAGIKFDYVDMDWNYRISRSIADLQLGLRWDTMLQNDRFHFGIQVGWEHHIYFSQNQFPRFIGSSAIGDFVANQGNLTFQGWAFSARFDF